MFRQRNAHLYSENSGLGTKRGSRSRLSIQLNACFWCAYSGKRMVAGASVSGNVTPAKSPWQKRPKSNDTLPEELAFEKKKNHSAESAKDQEMTRVKLRV